MNNQTQVSDRLLAPNIYLFAYQLYDKQTAGKSNPFWQECDRFLSQFQVKFPTQDLDFPKDGNSDRAILLKGKTAIDFTQFDSPQISGYAQPLQIKDSYAFFFNIGYDDEQESLEVVDVEAIKNLIPNPLLVDRQNDNFLGETLLLTAYLPSANKQHNSEYLRNLANNCYQTLFNNAPQLYRSGELFGSSIFEYGNPKQTNNYYHVLIWLFRDEQANSQTNKCLNHITDLLFYRSKITKAFQDSRLIYDNLDKAYSQIEVNLDRIQQKLDTSNTNNTYLDDFKTQLKTLARESLSYTRLLRKMEDFGNTIEINIYNYNEKIEEICGTIEIDKEELSFFKYFGQETGPLFSRQIKADVGYFEHGTDLIEQAIASIRGIVEIDQAERDRQRQEAEQTKQKQQEKANQDLQDQIQAVGVGIAVGAIVSSVSGLITQPWSLPSRDRIFLPPHPFVIALVASVLCSMGAFWLAKQAINRKRKHSKSKSNSNS